MEVHGGTTRGHYAGHTTTQKILRIGLWWATLHQDSKSHCKACNISQRTGKPSRRDEMPLNPQITLQLFEKCEINFAGLITPQGNMSVHYMITAMEYLTRSAEAQLVKDCTTATAMKFLFENMLTRFGCLKILMSDHGTHFLNETISALTEEFQVHHQKSTQYHPQVNGTVEEFKKILENALTKVCNAQRNDWDLRVPTILWAYRTTCNKLMGHTPFFMKPSHKKIEKIDQHLRIQPLRGGNLLYIT